MSNIKLSGIVKPFEGNGRKLGYPTANIEIPADTAEDQLGVTHLQQGA